ncbi:hypothetical protein D3C80_1450950 [compost metagenome]
MLQLHQAKRGLNFVHFGVNTRRNDGRLVGKAKVFEIVDALLHSGVRTDNRPAFKGVEHLRGVEAQNRQIAAVQYALAIFFHAERVGRIVNHLQTPGIGNLLDAVDIARNPVAVHGQDRRGGRRDQLFKLRRIDIAGDRINIREDRRETVPQQ